MTTTLGRLTSVLVLLAVALGGCGGSTQSKASGPAGILRLSDEGIPDLTPADLDPPAETLGANSIAVMSLIDGGLVRLDANLHIAPDGASSWSVGNGGRTYTFHIRPHLRFADGTPVTAADFAYSLDRAFSPRYAGAANAQAFLSHIVGGAAVTAGKAKSVSGVRVLGRDTLQITTDKPVAVFLDELANPVAAVVPRHLIQRYGPEAWTEHAVGTGPFYVKDLQHGKEIDLAPNPYYWRGKPALKEVRILFVQNPDTAYNLYRTGSLDVMGMVQFPSDKLAEGRKLSAFHSAPYLFTEYLPPNERKPPFNNVHVRRAFSLAIDRTALVNRFLGGQYVPANGILPPGMPGYNSHLRGEQFNPTQAQAELARAGYPGGKGFPSVSLSFSGGDPGQRASAQVLQRFWSKYLHVSVGLNQMEQGAYNNALNAENFQLAFISWGMDYPDPQDFLSLQLQTGVGNNNAGFSNARFDALTKQADTMVGQNAARYKLYRQAEQIALDRAAWIVLYWGRTDVLINPRVHGLILNGGGLTAPNWASVTAG
ncbi:MAG TPA: peptide ABC transporter substrate-binding protein [Chloroflexota bacterium]|nr:peptide ABC transporter substrate-binding protein [Chloroflexota bacterium]